MSVFTLASARRVGQGVFQLYEGIRVPATEAPLPPGVGICIICLVMLRFEFERQQTSIPEFAVFHNCGWSAVATRLTGLEFFFEFINAVLFVFES